MNLNEPEGITAPQPCETASRRRIFSIGLPRCNNAAERRFPLTPEAVNKIGRAHV